MPVISFVSSKGGAGKTTAALVVIGEILDAGGSVTIIDADPNNGLSEWAKLTGKRKGLRVVKDVTEETIIEEIDDAVTKTGFVVIDLEGTANMLVGFAVSQSDLAIVPCKGSRLDEQQVGRTVKFIERAAKGFKLKVQTRVLLSQTSAAIESKNVREVKKNLDRNKVARFRTEMIEREAYRTPFFMGGTIHDLRKGEVSNIQGAKENAAALMEEVVAIISPEVLKFEGKGVAA